MSALRRSAADLWSTQPLRLPLPVSRQTRSLRADWALADANASDGSRPPIWFALSAEQPLACFAGIWANWTSVRKVKTGETTNDLFAFLPTEPNTLVTTYHPKAMPEILTN